MRTLGVDRVKRLHMYASLGFFVVLAVILYWWLSCENSHNLIKRGPRDPKSNEPIAQVETVPIRGGTITETVTVYGATIPAPGALQTISVAFESRVRDVLVTDGQAVEEGEALLEIEPSPDTYLQLEQARNSYESAEKSLEHFQRLLDLKLATNDQLTKAKESFRQAQLNLQSMRERGINGPRKLKANVAGLIKRVNVQEGSIVPVGSTLVEIVVQNRLEVLLGVEPEDLEKLKPAQEVSISLANVPGSAGVSGKIRKISNSVNPDTRLVDVFVALPETLPSYPKFLLGEFIVGKINIASSTGLMVPREAVLPEGDHYQMFTVKNHRAVKHSVQIGLENDKEVEVMGPDIKPGEPVVTLGNYELKNDMAVEIGVSK
jgi:membrane fusion protein (multidrug efflux system)